MDRFYTFLPALCVLITVVVGALACLKYAERRFADKTNDLEWRKQNAWKMLAHFGLPLTSLTVVVNVLVFIAPLVVIFERPSQMAWYGIFLSSVFSSLLYHYQSRKKVEGMRGRSVFTAWLFLAYVFSGYYGILYQSIWLSFGLYVLIVFILPVFIALLPILVYLLFIVLEGLWYRIFR
jgi:hypothetical protein